MRQERPSHPALNVRDDREAPLLSEAGWREVLKMICPTGQAKCLRQIGTTGKSADERNDRIAGVKVSSSLRGAKATKQSRLSHRRDFWIASLALAMTVELSFRGASATSEFLPCPGRGAARSAAPQSRDLCEDDEPARERWTPDQQRTTPLRGAVRSVRGKRTAETTA
jgi:hypothetical protein